MDLSFHVHWIIELEDKDFFVKCMGESVGVVAVRLLQLFNKIVNDWYIVICYKDKLWIDQQIAIYRMSIYYNCQYITVGISTTHNLYCLIMKKLYLKTTVIIINLHFKILKKIINKWSWFPCFNKFHFLHLHSLYFLILFNQCCHLFFIFHILLLVMWHVRYPLWCRCVKK